MDAFIPKEHPDLPKSYGLTIVLDNGTSDTIETASHAFRKGNQDGVFESYLDIRTLDNELVVIPAHRIVLISFDKRWSKIEEIRKELKKKEK